MRITFFSLFVCGQLLWANLSPPPTAFYQPFAPAQPSKPKPQANAWEPTRISGEGHRNTSTKTRRDNAGGLGLVEKEIAHILGTENSQKGKAARRAARKPKLRRQFGMDTVHNSLALDSESELLGIDSDFTESLSATAEREIESVLEPAKKVAVRDTRVNWDAIELSANQFEDQRQQLTEQIGNPMITRKQRRKLRRKLRKMTREFHSEGIVEDSFH